MTRTTHLGRTHFSKTLVGLVAAALVATIWVAPATADPPPYPLPVSLPSASAVSPSFDAAAPYTPAVLSLIAQLEPTNPPTLAQVQNLGTLVHDGASPDCHNVGPVGRPYGVDASGNVAGTTLAAAAAVGATNIKVTSVTPFAAGQTIWIDATSDAEQATIAAVGTAGSGGTGVDLTTPLVKAHANGRPAYVSLTTPSISFICWTDAQGVLNTSGPNSRGSTGPMTLMGLAASFDRSLGNVWGQTEGAESRAFMVTGMFGPQTDLDRQSNWGRNLTTTGEDPFLSHELVASQIQGMQGAGAMSQMKHFVVYNGQNQNANTDISDQALHELYLTPYEGGFVNGRAAATMCSYQIWRDTSTNPALANPISALSNTSPLSPYTQPGENPQTWPLNESHFSCEQPLSLDQVLHDTWGSQAFVGSDYPATHSTSAITNGMDQEMPTQNGFLAGGNGTTDPTGSTCAYFTGNPGGFPAGTWDPNCTSDSSHIGGLPNGFQGGSTAAGCPAPATATSAGGCTLNAAIAGQVLPLSVINQSIARVLYEEERFGLLGCDPVPTATCTNPGGVGSDRSGTAPLPLGAAGQLGTKYGDAAVVEKYSEEGATLRKNDGHALPLTSSDIAGGILVTGSGANHTVADPTNEASTGFIDRDAINPLEQLKLFSANPGAFTFVPANDPTGQPVPCLVTNDTSPTGAAPAAAPPAACDATSGLQRSSGATVAGLAPDQVDQSVDYTTATTAGQLAGNTAYQWSGWVYVPSADTYTWSLQYNVPNANVTFGFDNNASPVTGAPVTHTRSNAANVYGATTPGTPTNAGYTQALLTNQACSTGTTATTCATSPTVGWHAVQITLDATAIATPVSFRFAFSRVDGDTADAAAAAAGKSKAIVFVNTGSGTSSTAASPAGTPYDGHTISAVTAMSAANVNLITAVAAANPNTIVVINNDNPVDTAWVGSVKSVLDMWFAGQEGGTSTARLLLGLANPGGHTALTWPMSRTDTIWGNDEAADALYPGSTAGQHLERLNGNAGCGGPGNAGSLACPAADGTTESEGIFTGYRYFDKVGLAPRFPFGWGMSYTSFAFSKLKVKQTEDGGADVAFTLKNTGSVGGADAVQVYVGPPSDAPAGAQFAVRSLAQFDRVQLDAGASADVSLHVDARQLSYWSEASQQWVLDPGGRNIWVGDADAAANLPLNATLKAVGKNITCSNQQLNATTIDGNLVVASGAWCDLVRVKVNGNLLAQQARGIRLVGSFVKGNVIAGRVSGAADLMSSGANVICNSTIGGNLQVQNSASGAPWRVGACGPTSVGGNFQFQNNAGSGNTITMTSVKGNLECQGNHDVTGSGNTVTGKRLGQCAGL
jgi:beta-glucosidase